jgi:hypothetical protein
MMHQPSFALGMIRPFPSSTASAKKNNSQLRGQAAIEILSSPEANLSLLASFDYSSASVETALHSSQYILCIIFCKNEGHGFPVGN